MAANAFMFVHMTSSLERWNIGENFGQDFTSDITGVALWLWDLDRRKEVEPARWCARLRVVHR